MRRERKSKNVLKKFSFLIVLLVLAFFGALAWWQINIMPANANDKSTKSFTVREGAGVKEIAGDLKAQGLIRDTVAFFLLVKEKNLDNQIQAGEFMISPSMNAEQIARSLKNANNDITITIPEGKRAEEIADTLQAKHPNYQASWRAQLDANEGYLFPDTYSLSKKATIDEIIGTMRKNFEKKYAEIPTGGRNLSKEKLVIISSMVEREAKHPEDRPLIASVILNRLDLDMPLQIDATVQYSLGYQTGQGWWEKNVTLDDLKVDSPYNTYQNPGLPPGPISNPGLDVMKAVQAAPDTDYLYYITDKDGVNHYAKTLAEHNANIKKYGL